MILLPLKIVFVLYKISVSRSPVGPFRNTNKNTEHKTEPSTSSNKTDWFIRCDEGIVVIDSMGRFPAGGIRRQFYNTPWIWEQNVTLVTSRLWGCRGTKKTRVSVTCRRRLSQWVLMYWLSKKNLPK